MAYQIKTLNAISSAIYTQLDDKYQVTSDCAKPDAVLVRSASMHDMEIPGSVLSIARAGAGYNNIPVDACSEKGICVFNTPGANANAVAEMVLAGMLLSCRNIVGGMRASIYNAMPMEGVKQLVDFMKEFEAANK